MTPTIDLLLRNVRIVTCTDEACTITPPAFVAIFGGLIAGLGPMTQLDPGAPVLREIDAEGALLTPGLIDCHTHLVHAGHRAREFELRLQGASYEEIARAGGGIVSTVKQTREAVPADLHVQSARRLQALMAHGVTTVEIKSTDAEGRLILADGLSSACRSLKPDYLVDVATLTGACMVALGPGCTGVLGNDDSFTRRILRASGQAGERMWQLPLFPEYREHIRSDVADVRNAGIRYGGAITAALFLQEFVEPGVPWVHLDIAGPAYSESGTGYAPKGASGHGVRTLLQFLRSLS